MSKELTGDLGKAFSKSAVQTAYDILQHSINSK